MPGNSAPTKRTDSASGRVPSRSPADAHSPWAGGGSFDVGWVGSDVVAEAGLTHPSGWAAAFAGRTIGDGVP
jgi:hypothetical protein